MFNVAIIGGEEFGNYQTFQEKCINCLRNKAKSGEHIVIYTTGDEFVNSFARRFKIDVRTFYTDWKKYAKNAIKMRNEALFKDCNALIIFDDGTIDKKTIINLAKDKDIAIRQISIN